MKVCKWCGAPVKTGFQKATAFCEDTSCKKKHTNHKKKLNKARANSHSSVMNNTMQKFEELFK